MAGSAKLKLQSSSCKTQAPGGNIHVTSVEERTERIIEYLDPESTLKNAQTIVTNVTPEQKKRVQTILARNK